MRHVEIVVTEERREAVEQVLRDEDVDYVLVEEGSDRDESVVIRFPIPTAAVDHVLEALREAGQAEDAYTVIADAETAITEHFDRLEERHAESEEETDDTVARTELRSKTNGLYPNFTAYVLLTLLSTGIATAGLLRDSALAVAGAMVVSPFVGAMLGADVGAVLGDVDMVVDGVKSQGLGLVLGVGGSAVLGVFLRETYLISPELALSQIDQIAALLAPTFLTVLIAVAAGAGGALAIATAFPMTLAGVAVAIALIPAAAAVGVSLAWGDTNAAVGSTTVLMTNVVALNVAATGVLLALGYRPERGSFDLREWLTTRRTAGVLLALAVTAVFVVGAAVPVYQQIDLGRSVSHTVDAVLDRPRYDDLEHAGTRMSYSTHGFYEQTATVTVTMARTSDTDYPNLADALRRRIEADTGRNVTVKIRFVDYQGSADGNATAG